MELLQNHEIFALNALFRKIPDDCAVFPEEGGNFRDLRD